MREHWARGLAGLTGVAIVLLSIAFAIVQNSGAPAPGRTRVALEAVPDEPPIARGRAVYREQSCSRCHSIAGEGNPRSPLDTVGDEYTRDELRQWIIAGDDIRLVLSQRVIDAKQPYARIPPGDLEALISFLAALRELE